MDFGIGVALFMMVSFIGFAIATTVFWLWMLIDCATRESNEGNDKIVWILVILFTHVLGAALYFFVRRPQRPDRATR